MSIPGEYIIDVCYIFFIAISIYFFYSGVYQTNLDYILGTIAIITGLIVVPLRNYVHLIFGHMFYFIYLTTTSLFSNNKYLLGLNVVMLTNIILLRYLYDGCLLIKMRNNDLSNIFSDGISSISYYLNGNYIYPPLFGISAYRLANNLLSCD